MSDNPSSAFMDPSSVATAESTFLALQNSICTMLESEESDQRFVQDQWSRAADSPLSGGGLTRVLSQGATFEQAGVNFSRVEGKSLPASATAGRPELAMSPYLAMGVSLVIHPRNPYVPTAHMNVRLFVCYPPSAAPVWWFGGGFDLTPYYLFDDDARLWHEHARQACDGLPKGAYARFKADCDTYFYLKHRQEARGIGGIFFDDLNSADVHGGTFDECLQFVQNVAHHFRDGYQAIVSRRKSAVYQSREREFQLYRRGRYVEFNLIYDRGTLFGLQSGGRTESILMSLPPEVHFRYGYAPKPATPEARLYEVLKSPCQWLED